MGDRVATKRTRLVYRPCVCVQLLGAEQSQCARGEQNRSHYLEATWPVRFAAKRPRLQRQMPGSSVSTNDGER